MTYPRVCWADDPRCLGRLVKEGPEQSVVKWDNGNETVVINKWIERVEDERILGKGDVAVAAVASPRVAEPRGAAIDSAPPPAPKERREPDELVERLKKYDAAELKNFAVVNGVWDDKYTSLPNPGLVRMNIINRTRAKVKKGYKVKWPR